MMKKTKRRGKEERTFEIFSINGRDAQNGRRSKVEITAQVDTKKKKKKANSSVTEMIEELGKVKDSIPKIGKWRKTQGSRSKYLQSPCAKWPRRV